MSSFAAVNQIGGRAVGDDVALLAQHQHPIDVFDHAQPVGDDQARAVGNQ